MPIRPENRNRYPKDWPVIALRIRQRAGDRCECEGDCGLWHCIPGDPLAGQQIDLEAELQIPSIATPGRCQAMNGKPHPVTRSKVVLTTAHLDHTPENCADENLKAWCQRCHNRYDAAHRAAGIKARLREASASGDLFPAKERTNGDETRS